MFFYLFFFHSDASLETDNIVINNAETAEITSILSSSTPKSNKESAMFPATSGEKNETPKLPNTFTTYLFIKINKKRKEKKVYLVFLT